MIRFCFIYLLFYLACSETGQVYSFGVNKFGELGLGNDSEIEMPTEIPDLQSVIKVACGRHHSAAIDGSLVDDEMGGVTGLFQFQRMGTYGCGGGATEAN